MKRPEDMTDQELDLELSKLEGSQSNSKAPEDMTDQELDMELSQLENSSPKEEGFDYMKTMNNINESRKDLQSGFLKGTVDGVNAMVNPVEIYKGVKNISSVAHKANENIKKDPVAAYGDTIKGYLSMFERPVDLAAAGIQQGLEKTGLIEDNGKGFMEEYEIQKQDTQEGYKYPENKQFGKVLQNFTPIGGIIPTVAKNIATSLGDEDTELNSRNVGEVMGQNTGPLALIGIGKKVVAPTKRAAESIFGSSDKDIAQQYNLGKKGYDTGSAAGNYTSSNKALALMNDTLENKVREIGKKLGRDYDDLFKQYGDRPADVQSVFKKVLKDIDDDLNATQTQSQAVELKKIRKVVENDMKFQSTKPQTAKTLRDTELEQKRFFKTKEVEDNPYLKKVKENVMKVAAEKSREIVPEMKAVDPKYKAFSGVNEQSFNRSGDVDSTFMTDVKNYNKNTAGQARSFKNIDPLIELLDKAEPGAGQQLMQEIQDLSGKYQATEFLKDGIKGPRTAAALAANYVGKWVGKGSKEIPPGAKRAWEQINKLKISDEQKLMMFNNIIQQNKEAEKGK